MTPERIAELQMLAKGGDPIVEVLAALQESERKREEKEKSLDTATISLDDKRSLIEGLDRDVGAATKRAEEAEARLGREQAFCRKKYHNLLESYDAARAELERAREETKAILEGLHCGSKCEHDGCYSIRKALKKFQALTPATGGGEDDPYQPTGDPDAVHPETGDGLPIGHRIARRFGVSNGEMFDRIVKAVEDEFDDMVDEPAPPQAGTKGSTESPPGERGHEGVRGHEVTDCDKGAGSDGE